ncbi:MAG: hypothetical protein A2W91_14345 [Bacteroidetes bacterium GWF2_38_335]|nr:MAG: hypothetical protein A2W91_14345 [Bacteroidetes bacterium GWF2_38_335]OFY79360.1 MAG: hypothetical protein A2281_16810 [Bacteroidetes bacterium RIFOXYA12_FULL_38_20]HBS85620.1 hypothetical protein [Bacteroidales bacterium]
MVSCSTKTNESGEKQVKQFQKDTLDDKGKKVTKIFYNLPSPLEMTLLIQRAGSHYNKDLINPLSNESKYTTNAKMSLNLGVYGTDLSYARLFDQIQVSIEYLAKIKKLISKLGIPEEKGGFAVSQIQKHMEHRDTLLKIIGDTYSTTDSYLKENDRAGSAVLVLVGGWVEALYISINMIDEKKPNLEIMERIAEQKYSLSNMLELLKDYYEDEDVFPFVEKLNKLYLAFENIKIDYKLNKITTDEVNKITTIDSKTDITVTIEDIKKISNIVKNIRKEIIE